MMMGKVFRFSSAATYSAYPWKASSAPCVRLTNIYPYFVSQYLSAPGGFSRVIFSKYFSIDFIPKNKAIQYLHRKLF